MGKFQGGDRVRCSNSSRKGVRDDTTVRPGNSSALAAWIWLPIRFRQRYFENGPRSQGHDIVSTVELLSINDVGPQVFVYDRRPGLFRMDRSSRKTWKQDVPEGILPIVNRGALLQRQFFRQRPRTGTPSAWLTALLVLWVVLEFIRRMRWRVEVGDA